MTVSSIKLKSFTKVILKCSEYIKKSDYSKNLHSGINYTSDFTTKQHFVAINKTKTIPRHY